MMASLENHLLYTSIVWIAAWLLTSLNRGTATTKYWIWVAAALNFLLPLSTVPGRLWPSRLGWYSSRIALDGIALDTRGIAVLACLWATGVLVMLARLWARNHAERHRTTSTPAVFGFFRPNIVFPKGIRRLLTSGELDAVLTHEQRHARRRDNLIRLAYEVSLCLLWFHPLVWMTGSRLALYRELSCDEAVRRRGDLISALAKLANPENDFLLRATATSFVSERLAYLAVDPRIIRRANLALVVVFTLVMLIAAFAQVAQSAAAYACALAHGMAR